MATPAASPRAGIGPVVAAACLVALSAPDRARAYAVAGEGEIVRVDVVVAWDGEKQVLALLPDLADVAEGAFLVVPVPPGTEVRVPPDVAAFRRPMPDADEPEDDEAGETAAEAPGIGGPERQQVVSRRPDLRGDRLRLFESVRTRDSPHVPPPGEVTVLTGTGEDAVAALAERIGAAAFGGLPEAALAVYADAGWTFAVAELPAHAGRMRFGPLAFEMAARRPTVPVRLAAGSASHPLGMHLLAREEAGDLGVMAFAFGLAHVSRPVNLDPALSAWMQAVGFSPDASWKRQGLSAGPLGSERHPLEGVEWDLVVPRPPIPDPPEAATPAAVETRRRGCGCLTGGGGGALPVALLLAGVGLFAFGRRRRVPRGTGTLALALSLGVAGVRPAAADATTEGAPSADRHARRAITYPEATEADAPTPVLRLAAGGAPLALFFADATLDPRGEVHFVDVPDRLGLRIAERTAYVHPTPRAAAGDEGLLTVTLAGGRPLSFTVRIVDPSARSDASVEVRTRDEGGAACASALATTRDELAECRETGGERALALIADRLAAAPADERAVEQRSVRFRDKQNRIYVEIVDAVRIHEQTFLRLLVENRDGSRRTWMAGEAAVTVVGPDDRRRPLMVVSAASRTAVETGEAAVIVLGLETPQLPAGARLRLALHEADGARHVVIDDLRL